MSKIMKFYTLSELIEYRYVPQRKVSSLYKYLFRKKLLNENFGFFRFGMNGSWILEQDFLPKLQNFFLNLKK